MLYAEADEEMVCNHTPGTGGRPTREEAAALLLEQGRAGMLSHHADTEGLDASKPAEDPRQPQLPRWLPYVLLMLAGAMYICLRAGMPSPHPPRRSKLSGGAASVLPTSPSLSSSPSSPPTSPSQPHGEAWAAGGLHTATESVLDVSAITEGYGVAVNEETRRLYGYTLILEAGKDVRLTVHNFRPHDGGTQLRTHTPPEQQEDVSTSTLRATGPVAYTWLVQQSDGAVLANETSLTSNSIRVRCTRAGVGVTVTVVEHSNRGQRYYKTDSAACKFVRREIRRLSDADREVYLDSLNTLYRVPLEGGRRRYGSSFLNNPYLIAMHNSQKWCLHKSNQFLTVHSAFVNWAEMSQGLICAKDYGVACPTPYWDHQMDTILYGGHWRLESPLFTPDWFGTYNGGPKDDYAIIDGRFAWMPMARPFSAVEHLEPGIDPWGYMNPGFTLNALPHTTRSRTVCGIEALMPFSPPSNLFDCFDRHDDWLNATRCMYMDVHGQLHSHMCGAWGCAHNLSEVYEAHQPAYSKELLSWIATTGKNIYDAHDLSDYRVCDRPEWSNCTCTLDTEGMDYDELYDIVVDVLDKVWSIYPGGYFMGLRPDGRIGFMSNGEHLSQEDNERLVRIASKIWCQGAVDGHFAGMTSLNDPVFYTSHAWFDRMAHYLYLAPEFQSRLNYTWTPDDDGCLGDTTSDSTPFERLDLPRMGENVSSNATSTRTLNGTGEANTPQFYTMTELAEMHDPRRLDLPYVYDDLMMWGGQRWQPRGNERGSVEPW